LISFFPNESGRGFFRFRKQRFQVFRMHARPCGRTPNHKRWGGGKAASARCAPAYSAPRQSFSQAAKVSAAFRRFSSDAILYASRQASGSQIIISPMPRLSQA
jgi:hypothetical protein